MSGFDLPTTVTINGISYPIRHQGDYRMVLDCFSALNDVELGTELSVITALTIFLDGFADPDELYAEFGESLTDAIKAMFNFFNCGEESIGAKAGADVVDWDADSQMIAGAINSVAGKEVRSLEYLHWWTFMGYYMSIGECAFSTIVNIRSKIKKGKKLEKYEQDFRRDNPQYFVMRQRKTQEEQAFEDELRSLWNNGD